MGEEFIDESVLEEVFSVCDNVYTHSQIDVLLIKQPQIERIDEYSYQVCQRV